MKDSLVILATIFAFVFFFSNIFWFLYLGGYNTYSWFDGIIETFFSVVILLTTANFPDIMLPQYNNSWINCFPFIIFLAIGLYFL